MANTKVLISLGVTAKPLFYIGKMWFSHDAAQNMEELKHAGDNN